MSGAMREQNRPAGMVGKMMGNPSDGFHIYVTESTELNNSGVHAPALLFLDKEAQALTVHIRAEGPEPGHLHARHIHGLADDKDARTPTIRLLSSALSDGHLFGAA